MSLGGALGAPMTAFQYDWNMLPIGQQLWLEHLTTYEKFPPLQEAASYNLSQVMEQVKKQRAALANSGARRTWCGKAGARYRAPAL